jgi:hypothetical protein
MVLTTHAVSGAVIGVVLRRHPVLAAVVVVASHFALDAVPHWGYPLRSVRRDRRDPGRDYMTFGREFLRDLVAIGFDAILGVLLSIAIALAFGSSNGGAIIGIFGSLLAMFPDALQLVHYAFPRSPFRHFQRFHRLMHATTDIRGLGAGLAQQLAVIAVFLLLGSYFR